MSSKNSNKINVPEARAAMDKFKMEAASEVDVPSPYSILYHRRYMAHREKGEHRWCSAFCACQKPLPLAKTDPGRRGPGAQPAPNGIKCPRGRTYCGRSENRFRQGEAEPETRLREIETEIIYERAVPCTRS